MIPLDDDDDDDDDGGNENVKKVSYLHKSFPRSYVKWWRNLAASSAIILSFSIIVAKYFYREIQLLQVTTV